MRMKSSWRTRAISKMTTCRRQPSRMKTRSISMKKTRVRMIPRARLRPPLHRLMTERTWNMKMTKETLQRTALVLAWWFLEPDVQLLRPTVDHRGTHWCSQRMTTIKFTSWTVERAYPPCSPEIAEIGSEGFEAFGYPTLIWITMEAFPPYCDSSSRNEQPQIKPEARTSKLQNALDILLQLYRGWLLLARSFDTSIWFWVANTAITRTETVYICNQISTTIRDAILPLFISRVSRFSTIVVPPLASWWGGRKPTLINFCAILEIRVPARTSYAPAIVRFCRVNSTVTMELTTAATPMPTCF
mmetsp:Transcript_1108/g.2239  ORF Transcript_1108/g.2239 Transcript_1108/m.2239 type:complete len:302 (+) Transcript_1108:220-1125(+)